MTYNVLCMSSSFPQGTIAYTPCWQQFYYFLIVLITCKFQNQGLKY